jgi:hypothetical protein
MTGINSVQQIVATIRAEMASRVAQGGVRGLKPELKRPARSKAATAGTRMGGLINQRVAALDPADPQRGRKAFRIFLESVLLGEFGEELMNDPAFYQMVDDVQQSMEGDARITAAIDKAVASLLQAGQPPA